jgi:hypothetical protein
LDPHTGSRQHVDESLHTEQVDFPANKIADPRQGYSKELCGRTLSQPACPDHALDLNRQLGS